MPDLTAETASRLRERLAARAAMANLVLLQQILLSEDVDDGEAAEFMGYVAARLDADREHREFAEATPARAAAFASRIRAFLPEGMMFAWAAGDA